MLNSEISPSSTFFNSNLSSYMCGEIIWWQINLMENCITLYFLGFPGGSVVKDSLANAGDMGLILGLGRSPWEGNGNSRILAWEIPWIEEPGGLQSMELQRVGHNLVTKQQQHTFFCFVLKMYFSVCFVRLLYTTLFSFFASRGQARKREENKDFFSWSWFKLFEHFSEIFTNKVIWGFFLIILFWKWFKYRF